MNVRPPALAITHIEWQQQVVDLAHAYHWRHLHVRRSIGKGNKWVTATNLRGWPDLTLWHETQQRTIAAELKTEDDEPTADQIAILKSLERAGWETYIWKPSHLSEVHRILRPVRSAA